MFFFETFITTHEIKPIYHYSIISLLQSKHEINIINYNYNTKALGPSPLINSKLSIAQRTDSRMVKHQTLRHHAP